MDFESRKEQFIMNIKKYRFVVLILLLGVLMMGIPRDEKELQVEKTSESADVMDLEYKLALILSRISGVGKVEVLLTEASGYDTIYQTDIGQTASAVDTVILMGSNREEAGLIKQIISPVYRGAVVVCQGADSASVRLAVVEAVKSVTGLSSDSITVLKMK